MNEQTQFLKKIRWFVITDNLWNILMNSLFITILIPYFLKQFTKWYKGEKMVAENTLTEFAGDTSIHGLVFMVKSTASVKRRILWTLLFIGSVTYAGIQIKSIIECKCNKIKQYQGKSVKDVRFFCNFWIYLPNYRFVQGLRSLKHWLLQKLSMKIFDQKFRFLIIR